METRGGQWVRGGSANMHIKLSTLNLSWGGGVKKKRRGRIIPWELGRGKGGVRGGEGKKNSRRSFFGDSYQGGINRGGRADVEKA